MKPHLEQGISTAVAAVASLLILATSATSARGAQLGPCSNATLSGEYGFTITGQILAGPAAGPAVGVSMIFYDGQGNLTQIDHLVVNGNQPAVQWRNSTGTYTLNADCTGTQEVDFTDGSPTRHLSIVVVRRGKEIRGVLNDPGIATTVLGIKRDSPL
jgi:hypothetical protein